MFNLVFRSKWLALSLLIIWNGCATSSQEKEPVDYVDLFLGTSSSRWMLYPGPSMPFGMVKLSPDNSDEWAFDAGYEYTIESVSGFGHVHSWAMGSFLTMPTTGPLKIKAGRYDDPDSGYRSRIDHKQESASPGYYSVYLKDYDILAELTATTRAGFQRYTFPQVGEGRILFDLQIPEEMMTRIIEAKIERVNDQEIAGYVKRIANWNEYTLHFVARFDRKMEKMGGWTGDKIIPETEHVSIDEDQDIGAYVTFSMQNERKILLKTGISYVSIDQARLNMEKETEEFGWDFEAARLNARNVWNDLLKKIKVEGGTETDKIKFYTNLYRSYNARTIFSDVNGLYTDMCEETRQLEDPDSPVYGCDAFWNTFWNLNQLWSMITPDIMNKWVKSLLEIYDRGGWLAKGPGGIEYSSIMVASHEIPLIVGAYQKGIRNYDIEKAYKAIREIQTTPGQAHPCGGWVGNHNLRSYMEMGYVPAEEGPVSNTLEYAYDDWCAAQFAKALGKNEDYEYFMKRSQNFRNVFDSESGYVRPKYSGGPWLTDFIPVVKAVGKEDNFGGKDYVEGNAWQFTWFVPHDVPGLISLLGSEEFNRRLDEGFEMSRPIFVSQFINHSNQPNMQPAYLFNYSGKPWLTQKWVREILDNYYGTGPVNGYPGDEDQGQMGAWYVMSAMGLFQMDGGASTDPFYDIGSPIFEKTTIQLDQNYYPGSEFVIEAKNVSKENRYIQNARLNGKPLETFWFYHRDLVKGGRLVLEMGSEPNKDWGKFGELNNTNEIKSIVTTPYIKSDTKLFLNNTEIVLACDTEDAGIYYTLDGSQPDRQSQIYQQPFRIDKSCVLKMRAYAGEQMSLTSEARLERALLQPAVNFSTALKPGLIYRYYTGIFENTAMFKPDSPEKTGTISHFTLEPRTKEHYFGLNFRGYINVPSDGLYTFYLESNDGSTLSIDDKLLINNDGMHPVVLRLERVALQAGFHPIEVGYFQHGGTHRLEVSWKGPGIEKQEVPASALFHH